MYLKQVTNVKLPDDDIEMPKHVVGYIIEGVPEEYVRLRQNVPYVKVHRYNPKHLRISEVERLRR